MKLSSRLQKQALLAMVAIAASGQLSAAQPGGGDPPTRYGLFLGASYSDNAGRSDVDESSETSVQAGMFAAIEYDRGRNHASLAADLNYQTHNYGSYDDKLIGGLAANAGYRILNENLTWMVEDNFGQVLIEQSDIITPDNLENLNVFSTGPEARVPLGPRTDIILGGRWTDVSYQKNDFGNRRLSGSVGIARQMGSNISLSLTGSLESVEYKELPASSDYKVRSASMAWSVEGARTILNLNGGYSAIEEQGDSTGGATYGFDLTRRLSARTSFLLHAGRAFGDSADAFRREQGIRGVSSVGGLDATVSSDPYRADYSTLMWQFEGDRSGLELSASWRREVHKRDHTLDSRSRDAGLRVTRRLSPRLDATAQFGYTWDDFSNASIRFDEWICGLGLNWAFSRAVGVGVEWDRSTGNGDSSQGPDTRNFTENRVALRFTWSPSS